MTTAQSRHLRRLTAAGIAVAREAAAMKLTGARLERAVQLVAHLYRLSRYSRHSWRRAESIGHDIDLYGPQLERALADAESAGLLIRRTDDPSLIPAQRRRPQVAEGMPA